MQTKQLWDQQTELFRFFESELAQETGDRKSYIDFIARAPQISRQSFPVN